MKNLIGSFFVISFFVFACSQKRDTKENLPCKKSYWEDGSIKAEGCFSNDSIKEGLFKRYFRGGRPEYEVNYRNNKKDGFGINYFENGKKQSSVHYKNGVRSGAGLEYYETGSVKTYIVYNLKSESGFYISYLEDGSIKDVSGTAVINYSVNKDTLKSGELLKIDFIVATPKNSKVSFQFYEDAATKQHSQYLKVREKDGYGTVVYQKKLDKKGTMNWGGTCVIRFDNQKHSDVKFKLIGFTTVK